MSMRSIDEVSRSTVLKYLGYGGKEPSEEDKNLIELGIYEIKELTQVHYTSRVFPLEGTRLVGTSVEIPEGDGAALLASCDEVILAAATLGSQVERWIQRAMAMDPVKGLIWDAVASSAIETQVEELNQEYSRAYLKENLYLTRRFSPGYGDVPLEFSLDICNLLETTRLIGLNVSRLGLLLPRKSITAFIGVSPLPQTVGESKCENCNMSAHCRFNMRGERCGR